MYKHLRKGRKQINGLYGKQCGVLKWDDEEEGIYVAPDRDSGVWVRAGEDVDRDWVLILHAVI